MNPGRELDALVAEKVFGWRYWRSKHGHWILNTPDGESLEPLFGNMPPKYDPNSGKRLPDTEWWHGSYDYIPRYSTEISAAWEVVEKLKLCVLQVNDYWICGRPEWGAADLIALLDEERAATPPHAICLAALKAVGVEVKD